MTRYRLTVVPAQFYEDWQPGLREFSAASDADAIAHAEAPEWPMKFIMPDGESCAAFPRKLEEIRGVLYYHAVRTVKEWS